MAISEAYTGSGTIGTTEFSFVNGSTTLATDTSDGVFQLFVDLSTMTSTEEYSIRIYEKATSGGTKLNVYEAARFGVQPSLFVSPSLVLLHGWDMTAQKIAGTDRSISWSIRKIA